MANNALKPGRYRHYKGTEYQVIAVAKHSETLADMVVYKELCENELAQLWVRPLTIFMEEVEIDGRKVNRFEYLGKDE